MESHSEEQHTSGHDHHRRKASNSELMSSAKVVAEAAKYGLHQEMNKIDKGKVAGAAADLIDAASYYGKLEEEKGLGKYMEKGEQYLHQYHSTHSSTTTHSTATPTHTTSTTTTTTSHSHSSGSGGGYEDYINMAQGFFKKH
ncbi:nodulin-related protein 1-like isoform X2 [Telopea speciosissima]|uniref:nodulin-related protein 1-like isoform X1 n=1 Tax=Telopea speciosissima TaxID=54955 RepID=UPI001CC43E0D|nr:nodulin-related protein 1-like isoform X1 [Telopea speciosissima]XP_043706478.1 nodulin-related protein 1-like isoform X2 [Telopea speciosissima]